MFLDGGSFSHNTKGGERETTKPSEAKKNAVSSVGRTNTKSLKVRPIASLRRSEGRGRKTGAESETEMVNRQFRGIFNDTDRPGREE